MILLLVERLQNYFWAVDNYLKYPKIIHGLRNRGVELVCTALSRRGCPLQNLEVAQNPSFNEQVYCTGAYETLVWKWLIILGCLLCRPKHSNFNAVTRGSYERIDTMTYLVQIKNFHFRINHFGSYECLQIVDLQICVSGWTRADNSRQNTDQV